MHRARKPWESSAQLWGLVRDEESAATGAHTLFHALGSHDSRHSPAAGPSTEPEKVEDPAEADAIKRDLDATAAVTSDNDSHADAGNSTASQPASSGSQTPSLTASQTTAEAPDTEPSSSLARAMTNSPAGQEDAFNQTAVTDLASLETSPAASQATDIDASMTTAALAAPMTDTFAASASLAATFTPQVVQIIDATKWAKSSSDPAGLTWIPGSTPGTGRLLMSDSEIDEKPSFRPDNLFYLSATGVFDHSASLRSFCSEPTGIAYNPLNGHLFISDDSARKIFEVDPNNPGTLISSFSTTAFQADDVEDIIFDPVTGHLLLSEGEQGSRHPRTIFEVTTTGTVISTVTMPTAVGDPEGFAYDPARNVFYVCGHTSKDILVLSRDGHTILDRITILEDYRNPISNTGVKPKGLTLAPSSNPNDDPSIMSLWVADYGADQVMDGRLFEIQLAPGAALPGLFTANSDTVNFNQITANSYLAGSQYDALAGNDTVTLPVDAAAATASGYDPAQTFRGGIGDDVITGGNLGDKINGDAGNDTLSGAGGNDTLRGGDDNDTVTGGSGTDQLFGDAGHDTLKWDSADSFDGGAGFDTLDANLTSADTIDLRAAGFTNLERILTGDGADTVTLSLSKVLSDTADNQFVADLGSGTDTLNIDLAGGWSETTTNSTLGPTGVAAGISVAGMTAHTFTNGTDTVTIFSNAEAVQLLSPPPLPGLFTANGETVNFNQVAASSYLAGTQYDALAGNDTVTLPTDAAAATASGYDPAQTFHGGDGNDPITGGNLDDKINGDAGNDTLSGAGGNDILHGDGDNDTVTGGSGTDQLFGDAGHDTLKWDSADSFDGGDGFDTLDANLTSADTIDLRAASFANLERILTGNGTDTVTLSLGKVLSDTADNQFVADLGSGTDTLNIDLAGGWNATTTNSTLGPTGVAAGVSVAGMTARTFTNGTDTVTIFSNAETVNLLSGSTLPALFTANIDTVNFNQVVAGAYLAGTQYDALAGDDAVTLPIDAAAAAAAGYDQSQTFHGGDGNDTVTGGDLDDKITGDVGDDTLNGGAGNDTLDGGGWQDILNGGAGNDTLIGGGSGDTLTGGLGDDVMDGGSSIDKADYTAAAGAVTVDLGLGTATGEGNDTLVNIETVLGSAFDDTIIGDGVANTLLGNNGNDILRGGGDNDTLTGGAGTDQLFGDAGHDVLKWDSADSFDGGLGFDTVDANRSAGDTINMRGAGFVDVERILTGSGNDTVTLSLNDVLSDTADNQFVADLGAGTDTLNIDLAGGWSAAASNSTLGPTGVSAGVSVAGMTAYTFANGTDTVTVFSNAEVVNAQVLS